MIRFVNAQPGMHPTRYFVLLDGANIGTVQPRSDIYPWATYTSWVAYLPDGTRHENRFDTRKAAASYLASVVRRAQP